VGHRVRDAARASPGFDATTAYVPLKGGQLVAVDLDRGTIRWRLELATEFTPATGEGLVFTVSEQMIEARDAKTGATRWRAPLPGGAAAPLYWDTGWLLGVDDGRRSGGVSRRGRHAGVAAAAWRAARARAGPALDRLFLPLADNRVVALLLASGETVWERNFSAPITALLALEDQLVFGTTAKEVMSVDWRAAAIDGRGHSAATWRAARPPTTSASTSRRATTCSRRRSQERQPEVEGGLSSRPAGGPLRLRTTSADAARVESDRRLRSGTGKPNATAAAAGEIGLQPYVRRDVRQPAAVDHGQPGRTASGLRPPIRAGAATACRTCRVFPLRRSHRLDDPPIALPITIHRLRRSTDYKTLFCTPVILRRS
jgi:hypothetical protein